MRNSIKSPLAPEGGIKIEKRKENIEKRLNQRLLKK